MLKLAFFLASAVLGSSFAGDGQPETKEVVRASSYVVEDVEVLEEADGEATNQPYDPIVALYIITFNGILHALRLDNGQELWNMDTGGPIIQTKIASIIDNDNNVTFIPALNGDLFASIQGKGVHRFPIDTWHLVQNSPFRTADGSLFLGTKSHTRFVVDAISGASELLPTSPEYATLHQTQPLLSHRHVAGEAGAGAGKGNREEDDSANEAFSSLVEIVRSRYSVSGVAFVKNENSGSSLQRTTAGSSAPRQSSEVEFLKYSISKFKFYSHGQKVFGREEGGDNAFDGLPVLTADMKGTVTAASAADGTPLWSTFLDSPVVSEAFVLLNTPTASRFGPIPLRFEYPVVDSSVDPMKRNLTGNTGKDVIEGTEHLYIGQANNHFYAKLLSSPPDAAYQQPSSAAPSYSFVVEQGGFLHGTTKLLSNRPFFHQNISYTNFTPPPALLPSPLPLPVSPLSKSRQYFLFVAGICLGCAITFALVHWYLRKRGKSLDVKIPAPSPPLNSFATATSESVPLETAVAPVAFSAASHPMLRQSRYETDFVETAPVTSNRMSSDHEARGGGNVLGTGGFGTVVRARNKMDEREYAIKKIPLDAWDEQEKEQVMREVKCLASLDHPNVVRYFQCWMEERETRLNANDQHATAAEQSDSDSVDSNEEKSSKGDQSGSSVRRDRDLVDSGNSTASQNTLITRQMHGINPLSPGLESLKSTESSDVGGFVFATSASMDSISSILSVSSLDKNDDKSATGFSEMDVSGSAKIPSQDTSPQTMKKKEKRERGSHREQKSKRYTLYIQMSLCDLTLEAWLMAKQRNIFPSDNMFIFLQIVQGLSHIHTTGLIHRDLKPSNIFLSGLNIQMGDDVSDSETLPRTVQVHIGDFGLSKAQTVVSSSSVSNLAALEAMENMSQLKSSLDHGNKNSSSLRYHTRGVGSPLYCSPEQLSGKSYSERSDIFSLGIIFAEMHCKFGTQSERLITLSRIRNVSRLCTGNDDLKAVAKMLKTCVPLLSDAGLLFVASLIHHDPSRRPSSTKILQLEFVKEMQIS